MSCTALEEPESNIRWSDEDSAPDVPVTKPHHEPMMWDGINPPAPYDVTPIGNFLPESVSLRICARCRCVYLPEGDGE